MGLTRSFEISASGMDVERQRLEVAAYNLANANTTRTAAGTPFQRKVLVARALDGTPGVGMPGLGPGLPGGAMGIGGGQLARSGMVAGQGAMPWSGSTPTGPGRQGAMPWSGSTPTVAGPGRQGALGLGPGGGQGPMGSGLSGEGAVGSFPGEGQGPMGSGFSGPGAMGADSAMVATLAGVTVLGVVDDPRPPRREYAPGHPDAGPDGWLLLPNVEPVEEMVNVMSATRAYEANAAAFAAAREMAVRAMEMMR